MPDLSIQAVVSDDDRAEIVRAVVDALTPLLADRSGLLVDGDRMAELLSVSRPTVDRLRADGRIPSVLVGRRRLYRPSAVIGALEQRGGQADE